MQTGCAVCKSQVTDPRHERYELERAADDQESFGSFMLEDVAEGEVRVRCEGCGSAGPAAVTGGEASDLWDKEQEHKVIDLVEDPINHHEV